MSTQYPPPQPGYPQPYAPPPGYEVKKKKRFYKKVWFWLLVIVVAIIIIVIASVSSAVNSATNSDHTVVYKAFGNGKADIDYFSTDAQNNNRDVMKSNVQLPFTSPGQKVKGDLSGFVMTVSPPGLKMSGSYRCEILVDGKVAAHGSGNGATGANCDASGYDGG